MLISNFLLSVSWFLILVLPQLPIEDPLLRSHYLQDTRTISATASGRSVMVWSAAGNVSPDKFHTTHDAITSCHFSLDDRICALGTQVRVWLVCVTVVCAGACACFVPRMCSCLLLLA